MSTPILGYPTGGKMCRIPVFITGKNNTLTNDQLQAMTLNVSIGTGTAAVGTADYALSKDYSIDEVINFEISDLIRDQFFHDFSIWDGTGYINSPIGEILWVVPTGDWRYSDNGVAPTTAIWSNSTTYKFLAYDGWYDDTNNVGGYTGVPLYMSRNRFVLANQYGLLGVNNAFSEIEITWNNGDSDTFYITATDSTPPAAGGNTTTSVIYAAVYPQNLEDNAYLDSIIKPSNHDTGDYYDVVFKNGLVATIATERFTLTCEPKYTPYQLSFVNRFGVLDYLTFFKRSDERGNFTQESYQKSIYNDAFTDPSASIGKYTSYNINSRNAYTLNTGFVGEDHDKVIEDILMSESVCLLLDGEWVAVVPERGSVEYQKHVNQKLINYTMTFNKGFDQRNLLR